MGGGTESELGVRRRGRREGGSAYDKSVTSDKSSSPQLLGKPSFTTLANRPIYTKLHPIPTYVAKLPIKLKQKRRREYNRARSLL